MISFSLNVNMKFIIFKLKHLIKEILYSSNENYDRLSYKSPKKKNNTEFSTQMNTDTACLGVKY